MSNVTPITATRQGGSSRTPVQDAAEAIKKTINPSTTYNPDKYYIHSGKDHRHTQKINFPRETMDAIGAVVGWDENLRTPQDFIRNAIHHALHMAAAQMGSTLDGIPAAKEMERKLAMQRQREDEEAQIEAEEERVESFKRAKHLAEIHEANQDFPNLIASLKRLKDMSRDRSLPKGMRLRYQECHDDIQARFESD